MLFYFALALWAVGFATSQLPRRWAVGAAGMALGIALFALDSALKGAWGVFGVDLVGLAMLLGLALYQRRKAC